MHEGLRLATRALIWWNSKLDKRRFITINDYLRSAPADIKTYSVVIGLKGAHKSPSILFIGHTLRKASGIDAGASYLDQVPRRSVLSRLTNHYFEVIANRSPMGFEAEFVNDQGRMISYESILLPCAADGREIDHIIGVINWRSDDRGDTDSLETLEDQALTVLSAPDDVNDCLSSERIFNMNYEDKLQACMEIEGALGVALVDMESGMALATVGKPKGLDLNIAAAGNTNVLRAKFATMEELGISQQIEDILITLTNHYHIIRPVSSEGGKGLFIYLALDKTRANLAMARHKLGRLEKELRI